MDADSYRDLAERGYGDAGAWVRSPAGTEVSRPLARLRADEVTGAVPWRRVRGARGQAHYPGWYWSATTGGHVVYESRLELARLLVADFDPGVVAIAAQPFLLRAQVAGRIRRHVPDFLLVDGGQRVRVVNVKPARQGAGLAGSPAERRMAVRLSEQRLRLVPGAVSAPLPLLPGTPSAAGQAAAAGPGAGLEPGLAGDDDTSSELDAPFPGEEDAGFYAGAMGLA
jgi:hypothetical protein